MYNLGFINDIESVKERTIEIQNLYILAIQKMANMQKGMIELLEELKSIENKSGQEFKEKFKQCKNAEEEYASILEEYDELEKKLNIVKEYSKMQLKTNLDILEKYKAVKDDLDIENFINYYKENELASHKKLDLEINELSNKIKELKNSEKSSVYEEKLVKCEKNKFAQLLGDKTVEERITQCKKALDWLENEYDPKEFYKMYTKFERILGIERQKPQIKFETKTNTYLYVDELGEEESYVFFERDNDGKLNSKLTKEDIDEVMNYAKLKQLTNNQMKKIDIYVANIFINNNKEMFNNYIDSIKNKEKPKFLITYDLRMEGIKDNLISKKELNKIRKFAKEQKNIGIAIILKDKSKFAKFIEILRFTKFNYAIAESSNKAN